MRQLSAPPLTPQRHSPTSRSLSVIRSGPWQTLKRLRSILSISRTSEKGVFGKGLRPLTSAHLHVVHDLCPCNQSKAYKRWIQIILRRKLLPSKLLHRRPHCIRVLFDVTRTPRWYADVRPRSSATSLQPHRSTTTHPVIGLVIRPVPRSTYLLLQLAELAQHPMSKETMQVLLQDYKARCNVATVVLGAGAAYVLNSRVCKG
ncbi:hypothetical protein C8Q76DRAFT_751711 [Earliella scabrosa]|nr:hypothetical protein C8Q76DRAFT_751711 [Earliella scabrosa]